MWHLAASFNFYPPKVGGHNTASPLLQKVGGVSPMGLCPCMWHVQFSAIYCFKTIELKVALTSEHACSVVVEVPYRKRTSDTSCWRRWAGRRENRWAETTKEFWNRSVRTFESVFWPAVGVPLFALLIRLIITCLYNCTPYSFVVYTKVVVLMLETECYVARNVGESRILQWRGSTGADPGYFKTMQTPVPWQPQWWAGPPKQWAVLAAQWAASCAHHSCRCQYHGA